MIPIDRGGGGYTEDSTVSQNETLFVSCHPEARVLCGPKDLRKLLTAVPAPARCMGPSSQKALLRMTSVECTTRRLLLSSDPSGQPSYPGTSAALHSLLRHASMRHCAVRP